MAPKNSSTIAILLLTTLAAHLVIRLTWQPTSESNAKEKCLNSANTIGTTVPRSTPNQSQGVLPETAIVPPGRDSEIALNSNGEDSSPPPELLPPGTQIYAINSEGLVEISFTTKDTETKFIAYRKSSKHPFSVYREKKGKLVELQSQRPMRTILPWLESVKTLQEIHIDDEQDAELNQYIEPHPSYLLIKGFTDAVPVIMTVGKRTKNGDYYISMLDGRVHLVRGAAIDEMAGLNSGESR